jgi:hypothetical protein
MLRRGGSGKSMREVRGDPLETIEKELEKQYLAQAPS